VVSATLPSSAWQCAAWRRVGHRARAIPGQDITDARQTVGVCGDSKTAGFYCINGMSTSS